jgi:Asp-tRNA(Asn)/Glu-tRNA(Gln) amidotransferase B subunit
MRKKQKNDYVDYEQILLKQKSLEELVRETIDMNTKDLLEYRGGNRNSLDKLVNEVMKQSGGRADPKKIRAMIINKL